MSHELLQYTMKMEYHVFPCKHVYPPVLFCIRQKVYFSPVTMYNLHSIRPAGNAAAVLLPVLLFTAIVLPLFVSGSFAQEAEERGMDDIIIDDVIILGEDGLGYLLAPLSFSGSDWALTGGLLGGGGLLFALDEDIQAIPRRNQNEDVLDVTRTLNWGGHLPSVEIGTGFVYLTGLLSGNEEIRVTGRMLAQTLIYSGSVYLVLRRLVGRSRPEVRESAYDFGFLRSGDQHYSFPSGHTVVAVSWATVLAGRFDHWAASLLLYSAAGAVGLARIYQDFHWASDVFTGALIGFSAGMFVRRQEERRQAQTGETSSWSLLPTGNGLSLIIRL